MTVIVKRNGRWNGVDYTAEQSVTNSSLETNMVNAGFARWAPGSEPANQSASTSSGAVGTVLQPKRPSTAMKRFGYADKGNYPNKCWAGSFALPVVSRAVRIGFGAALGSSAWTIEAFSVGTSTSIDNDYMCYGDTPIIGTFDNYASNSKDIPAGVGLAGQNFQLQQFYFSDWSTLKNPQSVNQIDGVAYVPPASGLGIAANLVIRMFSASGGVVFGTQAQPLNYAKDLPLPYRTNWKDAATGSGNNLVQGTQAPLGVAFSGTVPAAHPVFLIEYMSNTDCISIGNYGDSIEAGYLASNAGKVGYGTTEWAGSYLATDLGVKVDTIMGSYQGQPTVYNFQRMMALLTSRKALPDIMLFRPYSRNSGSDIQGQVAYVLPFIQECVAAGVTPVVLGGIYESATTANNATWLAVDAAAKAVCDTYGVLFVDNSAVITATNAATMLNADGIHPETATGIPAMGRNYATALTPLIKKLTGWASSFA
jgi:hypothetical protein